MKPNGDIYVLALVWRPLHLTEQHALVSPVTGCNKSVTYSLILHLLWPCMQTHRNCSEGLKVQLPICQDQRTDFPKTAYIKFRRHFDAQQQQHPTTAWHHISTDRLVLGLGCLVDITLRCIHWEDITAQGVHVTNKKLTRCTSHT